MSMINKPELDIDTIISQLLSVKDQPGKQVRRDIMYFLLVRGGVI
jgi:hypothetical protein